MKIKKLNVIPAIGTMFLLNSISYADVAMPDYPTRRVEQNVSAILNAVSWLGIIIFIPLAIISIIAGIFLLVTSKNKEQIKKKKMKTIGIIVLILGVIFVFLGIAPLFAKIIFNVMS